MKLSLGVMTGAFSGVLLLSGCSSIGIGSSEDQAMQPLEYCSAIAPVWDSTAIPNFDDEMSGAERETAITSFRTAIDTLPQGVALGALTQEQSDLMVRALPVYLALYEDPSLVEAGPSAAAESIGLSMEEFEGLNSPENNALAEEAGQSLSAYCVPSGN